MGIQRRPPVVLDAGDITQGLNQGEVPVLGGAGQFISSGIAIGSDGSMTVAGAIKAGLNQYELGRTDTVHRISSSGENVVFSNNVSGIPYTPGSWANASEVSDWSPVVRRKSGSNMEFALQPTVSAGQSAVDAPVVRTISESIRVYNFKINSEVVQTSCSLIVQQGGVSIFQSGDFQILGTGEQLIDLETVSGGPEFFDISAGVDYTFRIISPDGQVTLRANDSLEPFFTLTGTPYLDYAGVDKGNLASSLLELQPLQGYNRSETFESLVIQTSPSIDTPVVVSYGPSKTSPDGVITYDDTVKQFTVNESGWVNVKTRLRASRISNSGVVNFFTWAEVSTDGGSTWVIAGANVDLTFDKNTEVNLFFDSSFLYIEAGTKLRSLFSLSSPGGNDGRLVPSTPSAALQSYGLKNSASAQGTFYFKKNKPI